MLSVRYFSRNCPRLFANTVAFHPAYLRIFGNQKPRNAFHFAQELSVFCLQRETLPRMVTKHEFVYAQNRAYSRLRVPTKRKYSLWPTKLNYRNAPPVLY